MIRKYSETIPIFHPFVKKELERLSKSRSIKYSLVQRVQIVLYSSTGLRNQEIASKVHLDRKNVGKWRKRYLENQQLINDLAQQNNYKDCKELILETLTDNKRSGRPRKFSPEDHDSVTAIACSNPTSYDWPLSSWSVRSLTMKLVEINLISDISKNSVHRILQRNQLKPHSMQCWIHSPEKTQNPLVFIQKARECSTILKNAQSFYEKGIQIISIDEKPGILLLKPVYPDL